MMNLYFLARLMIEVRPEDEIMNGFVSSHFNEFRLRFSASRESVFRNEASFACGRLAGCRRAIFDTLRD